LEYEELKPNPDSLNPTDWDQAFVETPLINLKAWAKSFESCFFEQKLSNELAFWAKFYLEGKFVFWETLSEAKRAYTKSEKVFSLTFGHETEKHKHAELQYNLGTQHF